MRHRTLALFLLLSVMLFALTTPPVKALDNTIFQINTDQIGGNIFRDGPYSSDCTTASQWCGHSQNFNTGEFNWFLTRAAFTLMRTGSPTGTVIAHLYNSTTQDISTALPDGTTPIEIGSSLDISTISLDVRTKYDFTFSGTTYLLTNRVYSIALVMSNTTNLSVGGLTYITQSGDNDNIVNSLAARYDTGWKAFAGNDFEVTIYGNKIENAPPSPGGAGTGGTPITEPPPPPGSTGPLAGGTLIIALAAAAAIYLFTVKGKRR